jgi:hypothetical protein
MHFGAQFRLAHMAPDSVYESGAGVLK